MSTEPDALVLLRKLQGRRPYPPGALLPALFELEFLLRSARHDKYVSAVDLANWARKDKDNVDTLCRVLVMVAAMGKVNAEDVKSMIVQLKSVRKDRRKPVENIKQPGERLSPPLF